MPIGKARACSARRAPRPSRSRSSCRRPTSPARLHIGHALDNTLQDILTRIARGCRARTRCGWSAPTMPGSRPRWWSNASSTLEQKKRTDFTRDEFIATRVGMEGGKRRPDHPAAPPPRRVVRLVERALHHGRGLFQGRHPRVRRAPQARAALSRQAPGQLGPPFPDRDQRPRGRDARHRRANSGRCAIRSPTAAATSRSPPRGPRRCSPTWRSRSTRRRALCRAWSARCSSMPITGRVIPIVADEHADPELGSGAVKITPGPRLQRL